jgi:tRNA threonylcarbamoyladenosine biosynthesis protein TsaE
MIRILHSVRETQKLARELAEDVERGLYVHSGAMVLALVGDLGAGKTTFIQTFLKSLGVSRRITSPTFLIMRKYPKNLYHIDCYRIKDQQELMVLGFREVIDNHENLVLIEWADKVKNVLPQDSIWIRIKHGDRENERVFEIKN